MTGNRTRPQAAVIIGTRPEAIKLAPVVRELRRRGVGTVVIGTGQHRDLVEGVLRLFDVALDHDLHLMRDAADLNHLLSTGVKRIGSLLAELQPRVVLVQGDTTSALAGALAAFNAGIPVAHVEAGLRSHDLTRPFPEEMHRRVLSVLAQWNFAPTAHAAKELRAEHVAGAIHVTGNTVVDAVNHIVTRTASMSERIEKPPGIYILATAHRRESWGGPIREIALGLRDVLRQRKDLSLIFATHPNPRAWGPVEEILGVEPRATVVGPLEYDEFLVLLQGSVLAVTDSGGIQEEGPTLGVPVLVTRSVTERPEGLEAGAVNMVGTSRTAIRREVRRLLDDDRARSTMSRAGRQVYGDGLAARRIADILVRDLEERSR
ncbi:MAG: UDP-N-acetylglucosamine 2-epimerase (non-hydrolyzing) [Chloroflexota bacterium]